MRTLRAVRACPPALRLLLASQFVMDMGFYVQIPFLVDRLGHGLGMSTALVGLVLGVRNLTQQGLFVLGGSMADRHGARVVIVTGCALRGAGFALSALGEALVLLLVVSVLSGVAGGLFCPAVRAYVAQEPAERRAEAFALLNLVATSGSLIGLLLGGLLLRTDFRLCELLAAGILGCLTFLQIRRLPAHSATGGRGTALREWREVLGNRRFLWYSIATNGMFVLYNQLYLLLPDGARAVCGRESAAGLLLAAGAAATVLLQLHVTRFVEHRGGGSRWMGAGSALIGLGFVPPLLVTGAASPQGGEGLLSRLLVMVSGSVLLCLGGMIAFPPVLQLIPRFGHERLTGTYFGLFYVLSGVTAAGGNAVVGWAMDAGARTGLPSLPWLCCLGFGLASAAAAAHMRRAGALPAPLPPAAAPAASRYRPAAAPAPFPGPGPAEGLVPRRLPGRAPGPGAARQRRWS
ncbi:MFS transporter [Streptomyces gamaensis]|uniref:MFS transporter n=1 Tax=Streptomyces gamaensis TaxID=1763542 RepID=A0ABW0Z3L0_9ACTN